MCVLYIYTITMLNQSLILNDVSSAVKKKGFLNVCVCVCVCVSTQEQLHDLLDERFAAMPSTIQALQLLERFRR